MECNLQSADLRREHVVLICQTAVLSQKRSVLCLNAGYLCLKVCNLTVKLLKLYSMGSVEFPEPVKLTPQLVDRSFVPVQPALQLLDLTVQTCISRYLSLSLSIIVVGEPRSPNRENDEKYSGSFPAEAASCGSLLRNSTRHRSGEQKSP